VGFGAGEINRHLCGSLLLAHGETIAFVAQQMGHSRPRFTLSDYTHSLKSSEARANQRLSDIFKGDLAPEQMFCLE
jgi:integrase